MYEASEQSTSESQANLEEMFGDDAAQNLAISLITLVNCLKSIKHKN